MQQIVHEPGHSRLSRLDRGRVCPDRLSDKRGYRLDRRDTVVERWLVAKRDHPTTGDENGLSKPSRRIRQTAYRFCRPTGVVYGPGVGITLPAVFHTNVAPECPARIIVAMANPATGTAMA